MPTVKIFISYAKNDYNMMTAVEFCCKDIGYVNFSNQKYKIDVWSDHHLVAGDSWKAEITQRIKDADVVLFLLSPSFIKSEFITNTEIPLALKRREESGIEILGIIIEGCDFSHLPLRKTQLVPSMSGKLKPVSSWRTDKKCWDAIRNGIEICAFRSINKMPWNKGTIRKLPPKLQDKNFVHNAPAELQGLRKMAVRIKTAKRKQNEERQKKKNNEKLLMNVILLVALLFFAYKIIIKFL